MQLLEQGRWSTHCTGGMLLYFPMVFTPLPHFSTSPPPLQAQWDPMTGQWVSMGPLMGLMQQQQQGMMPPYAMVGYNLGAPGGPGGMVDPSLMPAAAGEAGMGGAAGAGAGAGPGGELVAPAAPEKITISQTFAWQVRKPVGGGGGPLSSASSSKFFGAAPHLVR